MRLLTLLCVCLVAVPAAAGGGRFISNMPDVPLMAGLEEMPQIAVIFDTPEGRVTQAFLESRGPTQAQIARFYADTLPQLGWGPAGAGRWTRRSEALALSFTQPEARQGLVVTIRIVPKGRSGA